MREILEVKTKWGLVKVKCVIDPEGEKRFSPEYESAKALAEEQGVPLRRMYDACIEVCSQGKL